MCWSKPDPPVTTTTTTTTTTTMLPTTTARLECPNAANECEDDNDFCVNGQCCLPTTGGNKFCVCAGSYTGTLCHRSVANSLASMDEMQSAGRIAAFCSFFGVAVIILFVALIFLLIKYYRHRKKQTALNKLDADRMLKLGIGRNDSGSRRTSANRPGYSWRESVRFTTSSYQTLQAPTSRSVPEDLCKMGKTLAPFGMKGGDDKKKTKKSENRNPDAPGCCLSPYADSEGGTGEEEEGEGGEGRGRGGEDKTDSCTGIQDTEENGNKEETVFKTEDTLT